MDRTDIDYLSLWLKSKREDDFAQAFKYLYPKLKLSAMQVLARPSLAEEVVQNLLIWVWNNPNKLLELDNPQIYLLRAVARNMHREAEKERRRIQSLTGKEVTTTSNWLNDYMESETRAENYHELHRAMSALTPRQRQILQLRYYQQLSYREIAEILSIKEQVARNLTYRTLKKLRSRFILLGLAWIFNLVG
ncbi:MAG: sigma-70 family RNA polymerase sigma factor [Bacteroidota bacterium]